MNKGTITIELPILDDVDQMEVVNTFNEKQLWYVCAIAKAFEKSQQELQRKDNIINDLKSSIADYQEAVGDYQEELETRQYDIDNLTYQLAKKNDNWNELKIFLIDLQKLKGINQQGFSWGVCQECLDKIKELENSRSDE